METISSMVKRAKSGDESAFSEVFNSYYNRVYYFVLHHVKSPQDAEDIVQNTFTEVFRSLGTLSNEAAFKSWLYTIAQRQVGMMYRKNGRSVVEEDLEGVADMLDDNGEFLPDNILESDEMKNAVMNLVKYLPDAQKSAVLYYYFEEMSVKEIAEIQNCPVGTVTSRLNYARRYIKTEIEKCREKGNYVLSAAPLPLLTLLFREMAANNYLPEETAAKIFAESCAAAGLEAGAAVAGAAVGVAPGSAAGSGATFFAKAAATYGASAVTAAVVSCVAVCVAVAGVVLAFYASDTPEANYYAPAMVLGEANEPEPQSEFEEIPATYSPATYSNEETAAIPAPGLQSSDARILAEYEPPINPVSRPADGSRANGEANPARSVATVPRGSSSGIVSGSDRATESSVAGEGNIFAGDIEPAVPEVIAAIDEAEEQPEHEAPALQDDAIEETSEQETLVVQDDAINASDSAPAGNTTTRTGTASPRTSGGGATGGGTSSGGTNGIGATGDSSSPQAETPSAADGSFSNLNMTPGRTESEMRFTWHSTAAAGRIYYRVQGSSAWNYRNTTSRALPAGVPGGRRVHQPVLSGLLPNTTYEYRIGQSEIKTFRTGGASDFSFIAVSDSQLNSTAERLAWMDTISVAATVFPDAQFVISMGDQVNSNAGWTVERSQINFNHLFAPPEFHRLPFAPIVGNHDGNTSTSNPSLWHYHYNTPLGAANVRGFTLSGRPNPPTQFDFYFRYGNVLFIMLAFYDNDTTNNNAALAGRREWLANVVNANQDADWRVAAFHMPPWSANRPTTEGSKQRVRANWVPVFEQHGIDIAFAGHDHIYSRSHHMRGGTPRLNQTWASQADNAVINPDGISYIVFGSPSGHGLRNATAMPRPYIARYHQAGLREFSVVDVTPYTFSVATFMISGTGLEGNYYTMTDIYTIVRGNRPPGTAIPAFCQIPRPVIPVECCYCEQLICVCVPIFYDMRLDPNWSSILHHANHPIMRGTGNPGASSAVNGPPRELLFTGRTGTSQGIRIRAGVLLEALSGTENLMQIEFSGRLNMAGTSQIRLEQTSPFTAGENIWTTPTGAGYTFSHTITLTQEQLQRAATTANGDISLGAYPGGAVLTVTGIRITEVEPSEPAEWTVTFDLAGGTRTGGGELSQVVTDGENAVLPTVERDGYTFDGWDGIYTNVTSDRTITAQWAEIPNPACDLCGEYPCACPDCEICGDSGECCEYCNPCGGFTARYILNDGWGYVYPFEVGNIYTVFSLDELTGVTAHNLQIDERFFDTHYLVIYPFAATSGSIWHSVDYISADGVIEISRFIPHMITDDEVPRIFVIEMCRCFQPPAFSVTKTDVWIQGFELTISAEEDTVTQGENFIVDVALQNISGAAVEIMHSPYVFLPRIPNWNFRAENNLTPRSFTHTQLIEPGGILRNMNFFHTYGEYLDPWEIGRTLSPGTHELYFVASFGTEYEQFEIRSNTLTLTVEAAPDCAQCGDSGGCCEYCNPCDGFTSRYVWNRGWYVYPFDFGNIYTLFSVDELSMITAHNFQVDEGFFDTHYLVIYSFVEQRSGSIRHSVNSISADGVIEISAFFPPDAITPDTAAWLIVIEMCRCFQPPAFSVTKNDVFIDEFVLTISAEETTVTQGENFIVDVELRNNSWVNFEITHSFLFWPNILGWHILEEMGGIAIDPPLVTRLFEAHGSLRNINIWGDESGPWEIGRTLPPGTHELYFVASFGTEYEQFEIRSNTLTLTVEPAHQFWLDIAMPTVPISYGDDIPIGVTLTNLSDTPICIAHKFLFTLRIPGHNWIIAPRIPPPYYTVESVGSISREFSVNAYFGNLPPGTYEIYVTALLYAYDFPDIDRLTEMPQGAQRIELVSNPIPFSIGPSPPEIGDVPSMM